MDTGGHEKGIIHDLNLMKTGKMQEKPTKMVSNASITSFENRRMKIQKV